MPSIYDYPLYYDIAFQRDLEPDLTFCEACINRWSDKPVRRILELGCGPGYHTRAFARRRYRTTGLDLSTAMLNYAKELAAKEHIPADFLQGDMRNFELEEPVDVALSMMASSTLIMNMDDMVQHFKAVARNLRAGGLFILEFPHPRDVFYGSHQRATQPRWTESRDGVTIEMEWGRDDDTVDSAAEIRTYQVEMNVRTKDSDMTHRFEEKQAIWTPKEIEAVILLSDCFTTCGLFGDFDMDQPFNNSKWSWRMIPVLKKK